MFELRDYQVEALDAIVEAENRGIRKQLIVLPTGAGKTVVFSSLPKWKKDTLPMLVLAHREELLIQAKEKIEHANPDLRVEIEKAEQYASPDADVVVASVASIGRADQARIERFDPAYFRTIVIDEAHHAAAPSYTRILSYFGDALRIGVTATPQRGDNVRLTDVFDEVVCYKTILELIDSGYLCRLVGYRVQTGTDISGVATRNGDYADKELEEAIDTPERNNLIVTAWEEIAKKEKTIVFCATIKHAESVQKAFARRGHEALGIFGHTDTGERQSILQGFNSGRFRVLINVGVLTEGFDEPSTRAIILARPTRSTLLYTQIVGRGTRLFEGKEHCAIIDMSDTTKGKKPVGLPTLFGLPPDFEAHGEDIVEVAKEYDELKSKSSSEASRIKSREDIQLAYERIDLFMPPPPNPIVLEYSIFIWAEVGEDTFSLNINNQETITIKSTPLGTFTVELATKGKDTRQLGVVEDLREAFARSDKWVKNNRGTDITLLDATSAWRKDPPTDKQMKVLRKYGIPLTEDLTKGQASLMIDKIFKDNPKPAKPHWLEKKIATNKNRYF